MATTKLQGSLAGRNFGNIRAVTDETRPSPLLLGVLLGVATGTTEGKDKDQNVYTGLAGTFNYDKINIETGEVVEHLQSARLFLPTGIGGDMMEAVLAAEKAKQPIAVQFAFKVYGVRSSVPAGYSWQFEPLMEASKESPIERLRASLPGYSTKQEALPAPETDQVIDTGESRAAFSEAKEKAAATNETFDAPSTKKHR